MNSTKIKEKRGTMYTYLRTKAIFMSLVIILAMFAVTLLQPVEVSARQNACCEKTTTGEYCQYTALSNCDTSGGLNAAPTTCEQTQYCQPICCVQTQTGVCHKNVAASQCQNQGGTIEATDSNCQVNQCQLGCCNIGNQYFLSTEIACKLAAQPYPNLEPSTLFDETINDETTCVTQGTQQEEGCCVSGSTCSYTTRNQCQDNFHTGTYCSNPNLLCGCRKEATKKCVEGEEDVYYFDSCGNKEGIAEDCDYIGGTLCQERNGEAACHSIDCPSTVTIPNNPHDEKLETGGARKHGESWCSYESGVGDYLDRPGSRHYRHVCINGKELITGCRDFREEICVQGEVAGLSVGNCLANEIYDSRININVSSVPKGQEFWDGNNEEQCAELTTECTVVWAKENRASDWGCEANCQCEQTPHINEMAKYCARAGDCGAGINVLDKRTTDGLEVEWEGTQRGGLPDLVDDEFWDNRSDYGVHGGMLSVVQTLEDILVTSVPGITTSTLEQTSATILTSALVVVAGLAYLGELALLTPLLVIPAIGWIIAGLVLIVTAIALGGGSTEEKTVTVACLPWIAPTGTADCERCGEDPRYQTSNYENPIVCSEYRCKSLGAACALVNEGTEDAKCVGRSINDPNSPVIIPWSEVLTQGHNLRTLANGNGYKIEPAIKPYTAITFGIKTDEVAQCKFDTALTGTYEEMASFFGTNLYQEEFSETLSLAGGQDYTYYIRCQDFNGNSNDAPYIVQLTMDDEPDKTPPTIETTSIPSGSYIPNGVNDTVLTVELNEPGKSCRWNKGIDLALENMPATNIFVCAGPSNNPLIYTTYPCRGILTNIQPSIDNTYYIRCEDTAENANEEGYPLTLLGTTSLSITSAGPTGTLYTTSPALRVTTQGGAEQGSSTCTYQSQTGGAIQFFNTNSNSHTQQLTDLNTGTYLYTVICTDAAGNTDTTQITFNIAVDTTPPQVINIYSDPTTLYITTNEPSTCAYSTTTNTFTQTQGNTMGGSGTTQHTLTIGAQKYYIICWDQFNNEMSPITVHI